MATWSLQRVYDYFGAHRGPDRVAHEIDRARQRFLIPCAVVVLGHFAGSYLGLKNRELFEALSACFMVYAVASLAFLRYLGRHPAGGVGAQYGFLLADAISPIVMIGAEPRAFGWLAVILLVVVSRTGMRYGMRTLLLSWGTAVGAAAATAAFTITKAGWYENRATYLVVIAALGIGVPLFIPVIKLQAKLHGLEVERVRLAALAESVAARSVFLSHVSHELKSPLQSLLSTLDLIELRRGKPLEPALMARMRRAAFGLATQLGDLLTLARGEAGSLTLLPGPVSLEDLFLDLADEAKDAAEAKGLVLVLELPPSLPTVVVDGARVTQIAENLLTNAIKYTDSGTVTLHVEPYGEREAMVRFAVTDTGAGVDEKNVKAIFAPYERGSATSHQVHSAGVGLAVVRMLLAYLGGTVALESRVGEGSTFSVAIPAVPAEGPGLERSTDCILIIDDREDVLASLVAVSREIGIETDMASSTGAASNLLALRRYDAVLFDLEMPVKSGAHLASDTRHRPGPNQHSRFIAMTASDDGTTGRAWPFDDFVTKPISASRLRQVLGGRTRTQAPQ